MQAADLLVWSASKFMKEKFFGERPPRRDFLSLMRHPHAFAYVVRHNNFLGHSIDNAPHKEDSFRDMYLEAVFSNTDLGNEIVDRYHLMAQNRIEM